MIRVLLADDHPVVRAGLRQILSGAADVSVVAEVGDGSAVVEAVARTQPDVLLLDITMPGAPFLTLLQHVKRRHPKTAVLVLSVHAESQYAVRAIRAGAAGYLSKERSPELLIGAVRQVAEGRHFVPDAVAERLLAHLARPAAEPHEDLSNREYEVLCLLGSGRSVKEAAADLRLSPKTVSTFRSRILSKMQLGSTAELIRYTVEHELL